MQKTRMALTILALCAVAAFGAPAAADTRHGRHDGGNPRYSAMSPEAQAAMQQHWNTVAPLRQQLFAKQAELDAKIASGASDAEIGSVTKDINTLSAKLNEAHVRMQQEMVKLGMPYGGCMGGGDYGHRGGMGYGRGGPDCCRW